MTLRYLSAGESHGKSLSAIIEGLPAGLEIRPERINELLKRRQGGYGRGGRMAIEADRVEFTAGLRNGHTLGSPLGLLITNRDWENWSKIMEPFAREDTREDSREDSVEASSESEMRRVTQPRPGHADLAGGQKYRQRDLRNILERASARETAMRTAVGGVAEEYLRVFGIRVQGRVAGVGRVSAASLDRIVDEDIYDNPFYCPDLNAVEAMKSAVDESKAAGDSLGGVVQVVAEGLPPGLGSHVHWDRRLDGRLAQVLMSIPAVKGVEIGLGFGGAVLPGSRVHDEIGYSPEKGYFRHTNRAGGIEGGITNGEPLVVRAVMKPIPTLYKPLASVDILTKELVSASIERSDVCAVPAAAIVAEAVVAWVLAAALAEKFGGDHIGETLANYRSYHEYVKEY